MLKKELAISYEATPASIEASVQPEHSNKSPIMFNRAISIWKTPNMTTNFFSP